MYPIVIQSLKLIESLLLETKRHYIVNESELKCLRLSISGKSSARDRQTDGRGATIYRPDAIVLGGRTLDGVATVYNGNAGAVHVIGL